MAEVEVQHAFAGFVVSGHGRGDLNVLPFLAGVEFLGEGQFQFGFRRAEIDVEGGFAAHMEGNEHDIAAFDGLGEQGADLDVPDIGGAFLHGGADGFLKGLAFDIDGLEFAFGIGAAVEARAIGAGCEDGFAVGQFLFISGIDDWRRGQRQHGAGENGEEAKIGLHRCVNWNLRLEKSSRAAVSMAGKRGGNRRLPTGELDWTG